jgi:hypothetical protein
MAPTYHRVAAAHETSTAARRRCGPFAASAACCVGFSLLTLLLLVAVLLTDAVACATHSPQGYGCPAGVLLRTAVETQRTHSEDGALTTVHFCGGAVYACHASGSLGVTCSGETSTCVFGGGGAAPPPLGVNETRAVVALTRSASVPPNTCWTTPAQLAAADANARLSFQLHVGFVAALFLAVAGLVLCLAAARPA